MNDIILRLLEVGKGGRTDTEVTDEDGDWTATVEAEKEETELEETGGIEGAIDSVDAVTMDVNSICDAEEELDADGLAGGGDSGRVDDDNSDERRGGLLEEPEVKRFTC